MGFKHFVVMPVALVVAACNPSNGGEKGGKGHGPMGGMPASEVTVTTATQEALPVSWEYVGQTAGSREVEVRARVTGILLSRNFTEGSRVKKGQSLSLQYHNVKDETIRILSGKLLFETKPKDAPGEMRKIEMKPGDSFHIAPLTLHRMTGLEDTDVLEVSTPELDDVVRVEDRYGRAGTSKP